MIILMNYTVKGLAQTMKNTYFQLFKELPNVVEYMGSMPLPHALITRPYNKPVQTTTFIDY